MRGALLLLALIVAATPQARGPWTPTDEEVRLGDEMLELLNAAREAAGVPPLSTSTQIARLAYQHAREMALRGSVTHHSVLYGVNTRTRFRLAFPQIQQFGENLALNRSPMALHTGLMNSAGHRLNRLDSTFTHAGFGVARANEHQLYLVELFARVGDESQIAVIEVLYTDSVAGDLPSDDPSHGEIAEETLRVGPPGPDNPEYWTRRGIDAYDAGRFAEAVENFRTALDLAPDYGFARFDLARALIGDSQPAEALETLVVYLQEHPNDADAWASRGTALLLLQRYDDAAEAFRTVLGIHRRDASAWYNLGLALEMKGATSDAERAYLQALGIDPGLTAATFALARVRR